MFNVDFLLSQQNIQTDWILGAKKDNKKDEHRPKLTSKNDRKRRENVQFGKELIAKNHVK